MATCALRRCLEAPAYQVPRGVGQEAAGQAPRLLGVPAVRKDNFWTRTPRDTPRRKANEATLRPTLANPETPNLAEGKDGPSEDPSG